MADIKDQLIKDSYNYVLQSDLSTGVVYRIGGSIPVNPIFSSGLTINNSFVYSGAGEQNGYALFTDGTGYAYWGPMSGASGLTYYVQSTVPPGTGYTNGDRWFDTTTGDETVWINDSVGPGQWIQPNNGGGGGGSPYSGSGVSNFLTIWNSTYGLSASTIEYNGGQYIIPSLSSTTITGDSIYSTDYQGTVVTYLSQGTGILLDNNTGSVEITNSDPGSGQNIFKDVYIDDIYQFSASNNSDDLRFSGIGVTITSGTNNTLIFSAGTSSQPISGDYLPLSGGTVTGETIFQSGVTANTISATTYYNLPVSGLTEGNGISISGSSGNFTISFTGSTGISGDYLPLSGGTVTGDTIFQSGLTANTISATTYYNYPDTYVTGFTLSSNTITLSQNRTDSYSSFTISLSAYTGSSVSGNYLPLSGGTVTGETIFQSGLTANTISATTYYNLPVSGLTSGSNIGISNSNNNFTISFTGGTVTGATNFTNGLSANTISATTYDNLPPIYQLTGGTYSTGTIDFKNTTGGTSFSVTGLSKYFVTGSTPTGVTINNGDRWFDTNSGIELVWITDVDGSQWIQPTQGGGGSTSGNYLPLSGGTVTGGTIFQSGLTANTLTTFNSGFTHNNSIGVDRYSGEVVRFGAGTTYASLLYYYNSSGNWSSTDANSTSTSTGMLGIGISLNNSTSGSPTTNGILVRGFARLYYGGWTTGDKLYVADDDSGGITNVAPTTSTYVVRIIGYVVDGATDLIYFCPDNTWIQLV